MEEIINSEIDTSKSNKKKIVFFVKHGLDKFLLDIINELEKEYITKKIVVTNLKQIDEGMEWGDICWFEWCDELVSYGSKINLAKEKIIICRLHSYEAFTEYPDKVTWENIDKVILVAEHIQNFIIDNFNVNEEKTVVIPNGIDTKKWTFNRRKPGFNIAYVGYINYKKGPMLLLHTFKAIYDKNNQYKLFIAGNFQDHRDVLYFNQMIKELGLQNNVIYQGWQNDLDKWLEDKNYILCTSILESQNISIMQAMAKGIKPIIHNFVGARNIYPQALIWNTIDDAVNMIVNNEYKSEEYSYFVEKYFQLDYQLEKIKSLFLDLIKTKKYIKIEQPLVTIGITNFNGKKYLSKCIDSFLNQSYSNIEILLIDDCSTDGSEKLIKDYEEKYKNINAIYHDVNSGGASKGIQEVIGNAKGKYFQWIACDDFVEKDAISKFVNYLERNPEKDYVYSDFNIINDNNVKTQEWNYKVYTKNKVVQHIFKSASGLIPMNCLYRLDFFKDNKISWLVYRGNDFSADTLNTIHFIKHGWNYGKIDEAVVNYRIHADNLSKNIQKRIQSSVSIFDYIITNFKEEVYNPEISWSQLENKNQYKNYVIAQFYYNQIQNHLSMRVIPNYVSRDVTKQELTKYCYVFAEEGMKYIEEGLKQGNTYTSEILELKELYNKYIEEVKNLGVIG